MITKKLQYFVGKVCTIFAPAISQKFNQEQLNDYFVGVVESIDETGILTTHPITGCKNFFFLSQIIGISEEQVLNPDNPEEAKIIEEFKKTPLAENPGPYINLDNLEKLKGIK